MQLKKYFIAIFILTLSASTINAQGINIKYLESTMVRLNDSIYACKFETSNAEYKEFLKQQKNKELYPDTANWQMVRDVVKPFKGSYFDNPEFDRYPVVCLHPVQVLEYCKWLTETYSMSPIRKYKSVVFRLPTHEEWLMAARGAEPATTWYPWKGHSTRMNGTRLMANYFDMDDACIKSTLLNSHLEFMCFDELMKQQFIEAVNTYGQTPFGVHNICGNVAEMLLDKDYAVGGSWLSSGYYLRLDIDEHENLPIPSPMVGFRVFMHVIEQ